MVGLVFIIIAIAVVIRYIFFWEPVDTKNIFGSSPLFIAHRGTPVTIPENTLESFKNAINIGFEAIEVDVCSTKDKVVVCSHNIDLERETNGQGFLNETNYEKARLVKTGIYYHPSKTSEIPTLYDVIKKLPQNVLVNIEIKPANLWNIGTAVRVVKMIKSKKITQKIIISTFNPVAIWVMKLFTPNIITGYLFKSTKHLWTVNFFHPDCLHPEGGIVTRALVNQAHKRGQAVNVWTIDSRPGKRWLEKLNVDGIITNYYSPG